MAVTGINSEDRLVQATLAAHLKDQLGWETVYAWNDETFGSGGTLGRASSSEAVLTRDLRAALQRLNPDLPPSAVDDALRALTVHDFSRSMVQHNQRKTTSNILELSTLLFRMLNDFTISCARYAIHRVLQLIRSIRTAKIDS